MEYKRLGDSDLLVSEICLGTMTYGHQNTIEDASQQLDYAVDRGVNFIDTAEMYPVPGRAETQGKTEEYIGEYASFAMWRNSWDCRRWYRFRMPLIYSIACFRFTWLKRADLTVSRKSPPSI
jgi:hypothetical protein